MTLVVRLFSNPCPRKTKLIYAMPASASKYAALPPVTPVCKPAAVVQRAGRLGSTRGGKPRQAKIRNVVCGRKGRKA
jgi:hypothetical protein